MLGMNAFQWVGKTKIFGTHDIIKYISTFSLVKIYIHLIHKCTHLLLRVHYTMTQVIALLNLLAEIYKGDYEVSTHEGVKVNTIRV